MMISMLQMLGFALVLGDCCLARKLERLLLALLLLLFGWQSLVVLIIVLLLTVLLPLLKPPLTLLSPTNQIVVLDNRT
jgi:hypothetical protein